MMDISIFPPETPRPRRLRIAMMTGQDCSDLLSSILRIDVDHARAWQAVSHSAR